MAMPNPHIASGIILTTCRKLIFLILPYSKMVRVFFLQLLKENSLPIVMFTSKNDSISKVRGLSLIHISCGNIRFSSRRRVIYALSDFLIMILSWLVTVSYTHLDVYKRQVIMG